MVTVISNAAGVPDYIKHSISPNKQLEKNITTTADEHAFAEWERENNQATTVHPNNNSTSPDNNTGRLPVKPYTEVDSTNARHMGIRNSHLWAETSIQQTSKTIGTSGLPPGTSRQNSKLQIWCEKLSIEQHSPIMKLEPLPMVTVQTDASKTGWGIYVPNLATYGYWTTTEGT
ncbi:hypothetical protein COEREDRAFT_79061 [Coemansia reversa NRRL 1564]|uniref:Uncharacterized protein n=1 Tax=Coemansia reversa (strain ATCC 12441 / NRRL 1564) TaxID=763665 RepID=A0A2G5BLA8_COERN|nr:hypothetical protein COEREDRAFT_79061 [Coemansia reversa NRRL 1564]|eukprot:PIA19799.1 hypothetical protein COEREDRAFT_79061 [Coemansia reversa NRRL 1564]